ncbi:hypothetical protein RDWZM_001961 [Blomia tropicalis]|uniref:CRAL-TRIO domain-containing protein n=1 Tax=Blomia tropicalis TaxID=40697 RepID=A0A9Q0RR53_BLOTA|nr:Motile sperm domain-containing protein 2 [Blomia tropicalis]KAJ6223416.1 hypothetical protein RDWZM_001961 [Blomia tropicalis]
MANNDDDQLLIERLRSRMETEFEEHPEEYHATDIKRVRNEEWQLQRFILEYDHNETKAFDAICEALKWKQINMVHERTEKYFPKEMWVSGAIEFCGRDFDGRAVMWEMIRNAIYFPEMRELTKQFIAFCLEKVDRLGGESGYIIITDARGAQIFNLDMDISRFIMTAIRHYPLGFHKHYLVDQPFLMSSLVRIVLCFASERDRQLFVNISSEQLADVIDVKYIPTRLKGRRTKQVLASGLKPMEELAADLGYDEDFVQRFNDSNQGHENVYLT